MEKKHIVWKKLLVFSFFIMSLMADASWAAEPGTVVGSEVAEEQVVLYIQSPGEVEDIQCQIGTVVCDELSYGLVEEQEVPVRTLLLLDNSLSVAQKYRPLINEIMNNLAANRMSGEQITVATFSDKITYLAEDSSDYAQLKQCVDGITYEDQETYLTDVLYEVLTDWKQNRLPGYKRIVIVSDGVDSKAIGYTKEELYSLLKEQPYPIYTIGCTYNSSDNHEALKNMFALSRITQASSWLLDEVSDPMAVVNGVAAGNDVWRVAVTPPEEVCDGTAKGVKLSILTEGQTVEASTVMTMPFGMAAPVGTAGEETSEAETEETQSLQHDEPQKAASQKNVFVYVVIAGCTALIAAVIIVVLVRLLKRRKEEEVFETAPEDAFRQAAVQSSAAASPVEATEIVTPVGEHTAMVWGGPERSRTLILTDMNHPARRFEVPITGSVLIGRSRKEGCQIVLDYEKTVSRRHCQIRLENGQLKIKDLESSNFTAVNGKKVIGETVLPSGSIVSLGNLKMKVELYG